MSDILVVKTNMFLRAKELNELRNYIMAQKETGGDYITALLQCASDS